MLEIKFVKFISFMECGFNFFIFSTVYEYLVWLYYVSIHSVALYGEGLALINTTGLNNLAHASGWIDVHLFGVYTCEVIASVQGLHIFHYHRQCPIVFTNYSCQFILLESLI